MKNIRSFLPLVDSWVKNYNLNVTEVLVSDFKNAFSGIFNFTVGILKIRGFNLIIIIVLNGPDEVLSTRRTRSLSYVDFNSLSKSIA